MAPGGLSESSSPSSSSKGASYAIATTVAVGLLSTAALLYVRAAQNRSREVDDDELGGALSNGEERDDILQQDLSSLLLTEEDARLVEFQQFGIDRPGGSSGRCIYLDYNGTTPVRPEVVSAMIPYLTTHYGNPSSSHRYGTQPREAVRAARTELARLLLVRPDDDDGGGGDSIGDNNDEELLKNIGDGIVFTGCGTEADNLAIHLAVQSCLAGGKVKGDKKGLLHVVTSNVEHPAITECLTALEGRGEIEVTYVEVNDECLVSASDMIGAIRPNTCLVTLMLANNEVGSVQPVAEVARECRRRGVLFHTDAAQAVGKIAIDVERSLGGADMVTLVGHKFGAPKGAAALYVRPGCLSENGREEPDLYGTSGALLLGGGQEKGRRAGTENVPYIVGMGRAASLVSGRRWVVNADHMERMRSRLLHSLVKKLGPETVRVNGPKDRDRRLPNTLSVGLKNVHGGELLNNIGLEVAASAGSACHASGGKISSILSAMEVPREYARGTLRLSVGVGTTERDVDVAADIIAREAKRQLESDEILQ